MEGSIEESVLEIQEDKRKLMALALSEKKGKRGGEKGTRLADIQRLLR
jgi:SWI/SNF-related matrix-associated actin-dependent regulator of chromatin subfamily A3